MHFSKEQKTKWLEDWKQSGKSAWSFAKEKGLVPQTFSRWTKTELETKPCFVEIKTQIIPSASYTPDEILVEKRDLKIHIPLSLGGDKLRAIMEGLGAAL